MSIQQIISKRMCEPLKSMGENEAVTKADLVRFADNLASVLADSVDLCVKGPDVSPTQPPAPASNPNLMGIAQPVSSAPSPPPPNPAAETNPDAKQPETKTETGTPPEGAAK